MSIITTRAGKGVALTYAEMDANFINLNLDKLEKTNNLSDLSNLPTAKVNLGINNVDNTADAIKNAALATLTNKTILATTNTVEASSGPSASAFGFRNKLINGDMRVWQRTTTPTLSIGSTLTADRWIVYCGGAAGTCQRTYSSTGGFGDGTATTLIDMFGAPGNTALQLVQRIESGNAASLRGKLCTISAWVSTSDSRSVEIYLSHANAKDNFTSTTPISQVSTAASAGWRKLVATFLVPNTIFGLEAGLVFGAVPGGVACAATQVQLEEGSVATPFEQRPYGLELSLCQRYYQTASIPASAARYADIGGTWHAKSISFQVTMRLDPTISFSNMAYANCSNAALANGNTINGIDISVTTAGIAQYALTAGKYEATAEL